MKIEAREQNAYQDHESSVRKLMSEADLQGLFITNPASIAYVTGYYPRPFERLIALVIPEDDSMRLLVPSLEEEAAREEVQGTIELQVWDDADGPNTAVVNVLSNLPERARIGVEETHLTLATQGILANAKPHASLAHCNSIFSRVRMAKDETEIAKMQEAARLVDRVVERLAEEHLRPGRTESEIAGECARLLRAEGADALPLEPQVLSGPRTALPHGIPGRRQIAANEFVMIDMAAASDGYFADITRTFVLGTATERQSELFAVVREAQSAGIRRAVAGTPARQVDLAARSVIEDAGLGDFFVHRTGHGLGLEVHEMPYITHANTMPLAEGMTITIEPGVYVPGYGGVRIEDDVVVRSGKAVVLTRANVPVELSLS